MVTAKHFQQDGTEKGTRDLPSALFECEVNEAVVHQAVQVHLANQRQGTAKAKGRTDVRGGGKKPYRQKGTGRARAGTIRSPLWRGGGVVFGPHPREYRQSLPKKMRRIALCSTLSSRAKDGAVLVVDDFDYKEPKTNQFAGFLKQLDAYHKKVLVVLDKSNPVVVKSARNIRGVRLTLGSMLNAHDVLWAETIILTQSALEAMEGASQNE